MTRAAPEEYPVLVRLLVGSHAHGLAGPRSDRDFREVFYTPTRDLLRLPRGDRPKDAWEAGGGRMEDDLAGWELAKLLEMVMRGHPNAVELLFAPVDPEWDADDLGVEWRALTADLSPALLCSGEFVRSTLGYGQNCLTKLTRRDQEGRRAKWKSTYLRIMYAGIDFLRTGEFPVRVPEPGWGEIVRAARADELGRGAVLDMGEDLEKELRAAEAASPLPVEPDVDAVNAWLWEFRRRHFTA